MPRFFLVLFALGFLFQGCTVQKRSLMPGWHVERLAQTFADSDVTRFQPVESIAQETSAPSVVTAPSPLDPLIPVRALMVFSPPNESAPELQMLYSVLEANLDDHQPDDEVASNSGVESTEPSRIEVDKKRKRNLSTIAALLGVIAIVALDLFATPTIGLVAIAMALIALRAAFSKPPNQLSKPNGPDESAAAESTGQTSGYTNSNAVRIAMGLLSVVLGLASIPAFSLGFFDPSLAPFALLGVGFLVLAWRSILVAFPNLRPRFERTNARYAARRAKREARLANDPERQWMWLLALIPVALLILFASSLSFPAFGM